MRKVKLPLKLRSKKDLPQQANIHQQIKNPEKLKLLVLSGSRLASTDFTFMMRCKNLVKLDLSDNDLPRLPEFFRMEQLSSLRLLYLHSNNFKSLEDIKPLFECSHLVHVTLHKNPISSSQLQHFLINVMKYLMMINERVVFEEERMDSLVCEKSHITVNIDKLGIDFVGSVELEENRYIQGLEKQLEQIDKLWVNFNPIVKLQRRWRQRSLTRKSRRLREEAPLQKTQEQEHDEAVEILRKCFGKWKEYKEGVQLATHILVNQSKQHLTYNQKGYLQYQRNNRVSWIVKRFLEGIRTRVKMRKAVKTFTKHLTLKVLVLESESSFYHVSGIAESHRIILATHQVVLLETLLHHCDKITQLNQPYKVTPCRDFVAIRGVDSYREETLYNMYRMFLQPSMHCIFLKRKSNCIPKSAGLAGIKHLDYISKQNSRITEEDQIRSNRTYTQLSRYIDNEYHNYLVEFRCESEEYFKVLLRLIYYYNTKALHLEKIKKTSDVSAGFNFLNPFSDQLVFYFDKELQRTTSAVLVQKTWRRFWHHKAAAALINQIKTARAASLIQHFYRSVEYRHRVNFNIEMAKHLKEFTTCEVYLTEESYFGLSQIAIGKELFPGLRMFSNKESVRVEWNYPKSPLYPSIQGQLSGYNNEAEEEPADSYHLFHTGSLAVTRVNSNKRPYIRFSYKSPAEAKKRVVYLGLFSYVFQSHGLFMKALNQEMIKTKHRQDPVWEAMGVRLQERDPIKEDIKVVSNQKPMFLFNASDVGYFTKRQQPERSCVQVPLRIYSYEDEDQGPEKLDENATICFRYFRDKAILETKQEEKEESRDESSQLQTMSNRRQTQKTKRMIQTLKDLTSPLEVTKRVLPSHRTRQRESIERKKEAIKQEKETKHSNHLMITEYKHLEIKKVRKWHKNMAQEVEISRTQRQSDSEQKKERVHAISLSNRERRFSHGEKAQHQAEFLQKNNFLFKQYMRMATMKHKMDDVERKRADISSRSKTSKRLLELKDTSRDDRFLQEKEEMLPGIESKSGTPRYQDYSTERMLVEQSRTQEMVPKSRVKRTREHMVHGIFPEEFYAIEKKGNGFSLPEL